MEFQTWFPVPLGTLFPTLVYQINYKRLNYSHAAVRILPKCKRAILWCLYRVCYERVLGSFMSKTVLPITTLRSFKWDLPKTLTLESYTYLAPEGLVYVLKPKTGILKYIPNSLATKTIYPTERGLHYQGPETSTSSVKPLVGNTHFQDFPQSWGLPFTTPIFDNITSNTKHLLKRGF